MERNINEILVEVQTNKKIAEGRLIGCFLNQIDLISDYPLKPSKLSDETRFYYNLINELYSKGYKDIDKVTIMAYLKDTPSLLEQFNNYGGYQVLSNIASASSIVNINGVVQDLEKNIMIQELHERGFNIAKVYDDTLKKMKDANEISAWFEYQLDEANLEIQYSDIEFQTFEITDEDLDFFRQGAMVGVRYNNTSPRLDYATLGFPIGEFTIVGSFINHGKTSFMAYTMFGMARKGQKVGIIANEQNLMAYKQLLIMYVLVHDLNYTKLKRKNLKWGVWGENDETQLMKVKSVVKEKYLENLSFVELFDYDTTAVSKAIRRWSNMGFELAIYDTLKADFKDSDGWVSLINSSRQLYQLAHRENIAVVGVMQLAVSQMHRRTLSLDVLANGKQASETASEAIFFRNLFADEIGEGKNKAKVFDYVKDDKGQFTETIKLIDLDPTIPLEEYKVFRICKTRNDRVGTSVLYHFNGDLNLWTEIGYIETVDDMIAN